MIEAEVQTLRTDLTTTDTYAKNITQWIKDNLGIKLEKITELLQETVQKQLDRQAEEAKLREESLWSIFNTKFDNYIKQVHILL
jgi:predicted unusual protein kinase regulating ubiquinone biosynthesis (AarF/ABC1/UbiB family)